MTVLTPTQSGTALALAHTAFENHVDVIAGQLGAGNGAALIQISLLGDLYSLADNLARSVTGKALPLTGIQDEVILRFQNNAHYSA